MDVKSVAVTLFISWIEMCPVGWTYFEHACFAFETKFLSRTAAQANCNNRVHGGHLANCKTEDRINLMKNLTKEATRNFWLGGVRGESDIFYWTDGTPLTSGFTNWRRGEPNNYDGNDENCVDVNYISFEWNDQPCHYTTPSICERALR